MTDNIDELNEETKLEEVSDYYKHLRLLIETMEEDSLKSNKGNKAAGVRLRKSLRHTKSFLGEFVKFTLESRG
jgi:hypothetical protein